MNIRDRFEELGIDINKLTDKKQQTDYKIKYVVEYVKQWAIISSERPEVSNITFIDCMCNAGTYLDGDLCTAVEVIDLFNEMAVRHPDKKFNVYMNDIDSSRIAILKNIIQIIYANRSRNLKLYVNNEDVNDYLDRLIADNGQVFGMGKSVVVYIDPFDFGTVIIPKVKQILKSKYCEVIFNFFLSDCARNINHDKERIKRCIGGVEAGSKDEIIQYIREQFRVGDKKFLFSYDFKTKTNVVLYQIIFVSPHIRGLEVLKDVLWDVFSGKEFHRNREQTGQLSLFSDEDEKEMRTQQYAAEARELLYREYQGDEISYKQMEIFLIENTMLRKGHVIKYIIQPMVEAQGMQKCGRVSKKNNYKDDYYIIGGNNE